MGQKLKKFGLTLLRQKYLWSIIIFILVWIIVKQFFNLRLLGTIFDTIINMGALALVICMRNNMKKPPKNSTRWKIRKKPLSAWRE